MPPWEKAGDGGQVRNERSTDPSPPAPGSPLELREWSPRIVAGIRPAMGRAEREQVRTGEACDDSPALTSSSSAL